MYTKIISLLLSGAEQSRNAVPDYAQARRPVGLAQKLTFNRTGDGYTDPQIYPDQQVLPAALAEELAEYYAPERLAELQWSLIHDRGQYPLFYYDAPNKEVSLSLDFLEFARFSDRHKHRKYAEQIITYCLIYTLAGQAGAAKYLAQTGTARAVGPAARELLLLYKGFQTEHAAGRQPLTIRGISLNVKSGDFTGNTAKILEALHKAKKDGVHLAVFPELIMSSYQVLDSITRPAYLEKQLESVLFIQGELQKIFADDLAAHFLSSRLPGDYSAGLAERMRAAAAAFDAEYPRGWTQGDYATLGLPLKKDYLRDFLSGLTAGLPGRRELLRDFDAAYADFGLACILPAAVPTGGQPYNGAYVFRADGTVALQLQKQRLADDPSTYFIEKHIFKPGDPNKKYVFSLRGWHIGLSDCEDIWQESSQKIVAKLMHATGGIIQDPVLARDLVYGAEFNINVSASPEQVGRLIPHRLETIDWNVLPENLYLLEGGAYTFEGPRSDTRKELIATLAAHHGTPFMYLNSLGGYDSILMAGGSFIYDARGRLLGTAPQYRDAALTLALDPQGGIVLPPENRGDRMAAAEEQAINNLILSLADYVYKARKTYLTFYNNASPAALFLQRVITEAQSLQADYIISDILRTQPVPDPAAFKEAKAALLKRGKLFRVKTHIMPTLNHRFFKELFIGTWSAIRNHSGVQLSVLFFPDMLFNPASLISNPIAKTLAYIFGASVIFTLAVAFLLVWPAVSFVGRIFKPLGRGLLQALGVRRPHVHDSFNKRLEEALQQEEKNMPAKLIFELRDMLAQKEKEHPSRVARRMRTAAYLETFFTDLLSLLRHTLLWVDRKVKDAQGYQALNVGAITGTKKNRGRFTSGGVETAGFNPAHTLAKSEIDILYLQMLKKDLAQPVSPLEHILLTAELYRHLQLMACWVENEPLALKIVKNIPGLGRHFWPLTAEGIKKYYAAVWNDILRLAEDPRRRAQLERIVGRLDEPLRQSPLKARPVGYRKPKAAELYWRFRPTRYNNTAPEAMLARIDKFLTGKNIKQMVFLKDYIDQEKTFSWAEYAHFLAYNVSRYDTTRHKNAAMLGPILNIKTPGSHVEILSQETDTYHAVLAEAQRYIEELKRIALLDASHLESVLKGCSPPVVITAGQNGWVERDYAVARLEARLSGQEANVRYPLVIIDTLNNATDTEALRLAKAKNLKVLVVTSPEELAGLRIPANITDLDYFYVFASRAQKAAFLASSQKPKLPAAEAGPESRPLAAVQTASAAGSAKEDAGWGIELLD
ncbi:MAG: hypothetical protein LBQ83_06610 [Candidatus Margulisbacteria bacterium]|jgi:predicted amidohydrolase|nr:hypothetical protein [Candidatus Margulisiibacteriota bacterium]